MSATALTVVAGFRDREIERLERWLESLAAQGFRDFTAILVDYGSARPLAEAARAAVERREFCRYVYSDTRGQPWSRARALNVGGRRADSDYLLTTDVDMVFPPGFLAAAMHRAAPDLLVHAHCTFLPPGFSDWSSLSTASAPPAKSTTRQALGGCQCLQTRIFREIGGFDEYYRFWGVEDRDLAERLRLYGLEASYLPPEVAMFHQWHPSRDDRSDGFLPLGAWGRMNDHFQAHRSEIVRNAGSWGNVVASESRSVLRFLDFDNGSLVEGPELRLLDVRPDRPRETRYLVGAFWELPPGHALAVDHAFFPRPSAVADLLLRAINGLGRRLAWGTRLGYPPNRLHACLTDLLEHNAGEIEDFYLGFPALDGVSLVVRGAAAPEPAAERSEGGSR